MAEGDAMRKYSKHLKFLFLKFVQILIIFPFNSRNVISSLRFGQVLLPVLTLYIVCSFDSAGRNSQGVVRG